MKLTFAGVLASIAACAAVVTAQEPEFRIRIDVKALAPQDERWSELRTKNFLVVGNSGEERIRKVAADLELFRMQFALLFPRAERISTVPTTVVVFRNGTTFRPYRRLKDGEPEDVDGYFQAGTDKHYIVLSDNAPNREIYRQYVRTLIPDSMGPVPAWFRIGLSEYFTTYRVTWDGDSRWIQVGGRDKEFNGLLKNESLLPLRSFFEDVNTSAIDNVKHDTTAYAQSWALVHYLIQNPRGNLLKPALEFFQSLADGAAPEAGFQAAFRASIDQFEGQSNDDGRDNGFRGYVRNTRAGLVSANLGERGPDGWYVTLAGFSLNGNQQSIRAFFHKSGTCYENANGTRVRIACRPSLTNIPINHDSIWDDIRARNIRLLSEGETDFYRGDLMLHIDRPDEAEGLLLLSTRIDSRQADAHAALGLLRSRQTRDEAALQSLSLATTLEPDNYLAHYYTALALHSAARRKADPTAAQLGAVAAELREVVELAPHFVEAAQMLAEVNAQHRQNLEESIDLIRDAVKFSPGRESLILTLANVLAANHSNQEAGLVLDRVSASRTAASFMKDAATLVRNTLTEEPRTQGTLQVVFVAADVAQESLAVREGTEDEIPEGVLVPVNSPKSPEGETVRGKLFMLDCTNGLTLTLDTGTDIVKLHSNTPDKVEFLSDSAVVGQSFSCGPLPAIPAKILYRPDTTGTTLGEPLRIEFTDDKAAQ